MTRHDITPKEVAERWLNGEAILTIAVSYGVAKELIERRLKKARETLPDLPWDSPKPRRTGPTNSTKPFSEMNDGKLGDETPLKSGSIVNPKRKYLR